MDLKTTLEELCLNVRNDYSSLRPSPIVPNRARFIMGKIEEMHLTYTLDSFFAPAYYRQPRIVNELGEYKYYNIIVKFPASNSEVKESIIFTAHHDINNPASQNCQDNTASVVNLLRLCYYLKDKNNLERNIYIVFTDCEEFGGKGAFHLSEQIHAGNYEKVLYVVNSELTATGEHVWSEIASYESLLREKLQNNLEEMNETYCPFNDSFVFRSLGIDSLCLGILPKNEQGALKKEHWRICHSEQDVIEQANYDDMERYVQFLLKLI